MRITVVSFENSVGLFFQEWGNRIQNDIKTDRILSYISSCILVSPFTVWDIRFMLDSRIQLILAIILGMVLGIILVAIIVSIFFGLFLALFKFIGSLLNTIGNVFVRQTQIARFSAKIIDQPQENPLCKKYVIQISNGEWFADSKNVTCNIGLVGHTTDYEDLQISKTFGELLMNSFPPGAGGTGIWAENDSAKIDIPHKTKKLLKFIKVNLLENKVYVSLTDYGKNKVIEILKWIRKFRHEKGHN